MAKSNHRRDQSAELTAIIGRKMPRPQACAATRLGYTQENAQKNSSEVWSVISYASNQSYPSRHYKCRCARVQEYDSGQTIPDHRPKRFQALSLCDCRLLSRMMRMFARSWQSVRAARDDKHRSSKARHRAKPTEIALRVAGSGKRPVGRPSVLTPDLANALLE